MAAISTQLKIIKKYKNRRLYDFEISQYITVDDLQRYVIDGILFQVIDAVSAKDITNATLLQIFVEMESSALPFLSSDMLRQLIVLAQHPMNKIFKSTLEQMMLMMNQQLQNNAYQQVAGTWSEQVQQMMNQWQSIFKC